MQEVQHENTLAALLTPLVAQIDALTTSVTALQTQLTTVSNNQDSLRALFMNSLVENLEDNLTVPVMNNIAPPAYMPTTVGELFNLQAGAEMCAIENYFNLSDSEDIALRKNQLRKAYGCRRLLG